MITTKVQQGINHKTAIVHILSFGAFFIGNTVLCSVIGKLVHGKSPLIYYKALICTTAPIQHPAKAILTFACFMVIKLLILSGSAFWLAKRPASPSTSLLAEIPFGLYLADLLFCLILPMLTPLGYDISWYYGSAMPIFTFSKLLAVSPWFTVSLYSTMSFIIHFRLLAFTGYDILLRLFFCLLSLLAYIIWVEYFLKYI